MLYRAGKTQTTTEQSASEGAEPEPKTQIEPPYRAALISDSGCSPRSPLTCRPSRRAASRSRTCPRAPSPSCPCRRWTGTPGCAAPARQQGAAAARAGGPRPTPPGPAGASRRRGRRRRWSPAPGAPTACRGRTLGGGGAGLDRTA